MKQLKVTVNGKTYDVQVEEVGASVAPAAASAPAAPAAAAAPAKDPAAPAGEGEAIAAPMPGTVMSVSVTAGQAVKKGDVLVVLEAMKMENEIMAPHDGTVAAVLVAKGEAVESGQTMLTLQ